MDSFSEFLRTTEGRGVTISRGIVESVSPLSVRASGDAKLNVSQGALCVSSRLLDTLEEGCAVYLLAFNNNKKYYLLDKV